MRIADAVTLTGLVAFAAAGTCLPPARAPMLAWLDSLPRPVIQALAVLITVLVVAGIWLGIHMCRRVGCGRQSAGGNHGHGVLLQKAS